MDDVRRFWYAQQLRVPRLILGILATGAAVVQNRDLVDEILSAFGKVVGLEMEAYAIFQAARLAQFPRSRVLAAKSVSDFTNKDKKDNWQQYAAFTSARFVYEFFTNAPALGLGSATCQPVR
jgi:nucleoside phosphorylase